MGRLDIWGCFRLSNLCNGGSWLGWCVSFASPKQPSALVINNRVSIEQLFFEVIQSVVIQVKLALQCPIRDTPVPLEQDEHVFEHFIEIHQVTLFLASAASPIPQTALTIPPLPHQVP